MSLDVVDLRNFYSQPLGTVARRLVGRGIRARWGELRGLRLRVLSPDRFDDRGVPEIIRTRSIPTKPMSVEEAVMQMDLTNNEFFVFRNAQGDSLSVIYRRKDGNYGLIESEAK